MKRVLLSLGLLLLPGVVFAFDAARHPVRVAVLLPELAEVTGRSTDVRDAIARSLCDELRKRGFEARTVDVTWDEALRDGVESADFVVELAGAGGESDDWGGVGVDGRHLDVSLGVIVSQVAADVRVYDAPTMELIATDALSRRSSALLPTGIGIGGADIFGFVAIPFAEWAQLRSVSRSVARDAASVVTAVARGE